MRRLHLMLGVAVGGLRGDLQQPAQLVQASCAQLAFVPRGLQLFLAIASKSART
jgi:hypothetical protein